MIFFKDSMREMGRKGKKIQFEIGFLLRVDIILAHLLRLGAFLCLNETQVKWLTQKNNSQQNKNLDLKLVGEKMQLKSIWGFFTFAQYCMNAVLAEGKRHTTFD